jgi:putative transposase
MTAKKEPISLPGQNPPLLPGNYYHLYNRGVNRQPIFFEPGNWGFFIRKMGEYFLPDLVEILAYCLMPNHYHILAQVNGRDISAKVMQPFGTSYVKAINKQQNRVGPLYQGPFKAKHVDNAAYLAHLTRYIHLNPVRAGLAAHPADWPYSSYLDYIGRRQGKLPQTRLIMSQFPSPGDYQEFVELHDAPMSNDFQQKLTAYALFE